MHVIVRFAHSGSPAHEQYYSNTRLVAECDYLYRWLAPELLISASSPNAPKSASARAGCEAVATRASDVYSLCAVVVELCSGEVPWPEYTDGEMLSCARASKSLGDLLATPGTTGSTTGTTPIGAPGTSGTTPAPSTYQNAAAGGGHAPGAALVGKLPHSLIAHLAAGLQFSPKQRTLRLSSLRKHLLRLLKQVATAFLHLSHFFVLCHNQSINKRRTSQRNIMPRLIFTHLRLKIICENTRNP